MNDVVIRAEGLGKKYVIGHAAPRGPQATTLREAIEHRAKALARTTTDMLAGRAVVGGDTIEEIWALHDIDFAVERGKIVGVIGRNGAGKSTLLKVLSRITEPTAGRVEISGRVASLLEVGTGFHFELTGRENIYLNGAILGMSRSEIRRKFDEIVAFAEVEKFLDTPVKRYSSGMYLRLAFSVAAHLDAEILAIDEMLAVGDAAFQKRCLGKMGDVARQGRTLLFVSHNMNAVERLCERVMVLDGGRLAGSYDDVRQGIMDYLRGTESGATANLWCNRGREFQNDYFVPERLEVSSASADTRPGEPFLNRYDIDVCICGIVRRPDPALNVGIAVYAESGELLFWSFTTDQPEERWPPLQAGPVRLRVRLPARLLNEGSYRVEMLASLHHRGWLSGPAGNAPSAMFSIQGGLSDSPYWDRKRPGLLGPALSWESS